MQGWIRRAGRDVVRSAAMATADLRVLPDLVVIGVKRGGTTSLFRDLERHPAMVPLVPSARRLPLRENMKGVHYFDTHHHRSGRWYRSHFATAATRRGRTRKAGAAFTAEASPYYFFHPLAAGRAADELPVATTFVLLLRDPVERTVSQWAEQTRNGIEQLPLAAALAAEPERVGNDGARLLTGEIATSRAHEHQSYAAQSEYADSLDRWLRAVGRERLLVSFSEDYYTEPRRVLDPITGRLGVDPVPDQPDRTHRNAAPRPAEIDPVLEADLVHRFRPDVEQLSELLGVTPPWPRFGGTLQPATTGADE